MCEDEIILEFARLALGVPGDSPYFAGLERALFAAALFLARAERGAADPIYARELLRMPEEELARRFEAAREAGKLAEAGLRAWETARPLFENARTGVLAKLATA